MFRSDLISHSSVNIDIVETGGHIFDVTKMPIPETK
jgi:hypothetical protein